MIKLSRQKLESLLFGTSSSQFVGITAVTVPDMRKTRNPYRHRAVKVTRVNGVINWRYSSSVKKQLQRENKPDAFTALPRTWGQRVANTPLVVHVGPDGVWLYLEVKIEARKFGFFDIQTDERIPDETLKPYLKPKKRSKRQGTDKEIVLRDYRLDHIAEIRIGSDEFHVLPLWYQQQFFLPTPRPESPQAKTATK